MAVKNQLIKDNYAIYNGDCIDVMKELKSNSIHLSVYSPPFTGLYHYSSSERDLSNCDSYKDFFIHYEFVVKELFRLTLPGRCTAVHCMDVPSDNSGCGYLIDFPGRIIELHKKLGFDFIARHAVWKEPLKVRNRTMQKNLAHKTVVDDSNYCGVASADYLLIFRKKGNNEIPILHPTGLEEYYGERKIPENILYKKNFEGNQIYNYYSHWIWRQYASSFWDDIRIDNVLKYKESKDKDDEKHVHPLQLDVIKRIVILRTNPGEIVLTPFMGVGSEVYGATILKRKGIGIELKETYFKQSIKNLQQMELKLKQQGKDLFTDV